MPLKRLSLRTEIVISLTFLALISILLISFIILSLTKNNLVNGIEGQTVKQAMRLKAALESKSVLQESYQQRAAQLLRAFDNVRLWDRTGGLLYSPGGLREGETDRISKEIVKKLGSVNEYTVVYQDEAPLGAKHRRAIETFVPIKEKGELVAILAMRQDLTVINRSLAQTKKALLIYSLLYTGLILLFAYFVLSKIIIAPVQHMVDVAEKIRGGQIGERIKIHSEDEIGSLGNTINIMTEELVKNQTALEDNVRELESVNNKLREAQAEIVGKEKLASVGRLAAGMAHEIGNPLGAIIGYIDILKTTEDPEERQRLLKRTDNELHRIHTIIRELLDHARPRNVVVDRIEVDRIVEETVDEIVDPTLLSGITIKRQLKSEVFVRMDGNHLKQVLLNLIINACHAMRSTEGERTLSLQVGEVAVGSELRVKIVVEDSGPGIDDAHLSQIFDPFFSTKDPGEGTGLGLYVSSSILEAWGGELNVASRRGEGASFSVTLPKA